MGLMSCWRSLGKYENRMEDRNMGCVEALTVVKDVEFEGMWLATAHYYGGVTERRFSSEGAALEWARNFVAPYKPSKGITFYSWSIH